MSDQLQVFLSNIDKSLVNQPAKEIYLGVGNCPEETGEFDEGYVKFDGYLIGKVIISLDEENIAENIQEVYYATSEGKIIIYECTDLNADIRNANFYELSNVNNFISKYPQLAKEIGLPKKPPAGYYSLDEVVKGKV